MNDVVMIEVDKNTGKVFDYWTMQEFADICDVTILTVQHWIAANKIESIKVANMRFIPLGTQKPKCHPGGFKRKKERDTQ